MPKSKASLLLYSATSPIRYAIYIDGVKKEEFVCEKKCSVALYEIFKPLLQSYDIETIYYARGPGSFMALKVTYIFLKTLSISMNVKLKATDSFFFSKNRAIRATKNSSFLKKEDRITITKESIDEAIELPSTLECDEFDDNLEPFYFLPAI
ncbi:MAG: hypothetical protein ACLFQJ_09560 [Campylobacterales bacterium]